MVDVSTWLDTEDDWQVLLRFLPEGWQELARSTGALVRVRQFTPESLLRALLIHLASGCSLRETAVRAQQGRIAAVSDVALLKRLNASGEWFRRMSTALMAQWVAPLTELGLGSAYRVRLVDGSTITEPGATGSTWRIHYSVQLSTLQCDEVLVTAPSVGESLARYRVACGDVFVGDRGYGTRANLRYVSERGGAVILRLNATNVPLLRADGAGRFELLEHLRTLDATSTGDWPVVVAYPDGATIAARLCAVKKSPAAAAHAVQLAERDSRKKGHAIRPETRESANYLFVLTTLPSTCAAFTVLDVYRARWQIELAFKRLKSLLGLGHLRKLDDRGAKAWLHGKLFVALLIEAMIACGDRFSPWGFPLPQARTP